MAIRGLGLSCCKCGFTACTKWLVHEHLWGNTVENIVSFANSEDDSSRIDAVSSSGCKGNLQFSYDSESQFVTCQIPPYSYCASSGGCGTPISSSAATKMKLLKAVHLKKGDTVIINMVTDGVPIHWDTKGIFANTISHAARHSEETPFAMLIPWSQSVIDSTFEFNTGKHCKLNIFQNESVKIDELPDDAILVSNPPGAGDVDEEKLFTYNDVSTYQGMDCYLENNTPGTGSGTGDDEFIPKIDTSNSQLEQRVGYKKLHNPIASSGVNLRSLIDNAHDYNPTYFARYIPVAYDTAMPISLATGSYPDYVPAGSVSYTNDGKFMSWVIDGDTADRDVWFTARGYSSAVTPLSGSSVSYNTYTLIPPAIGRGFVQYGSYDDEWEIIRPIDTADTTYIDEQVAFFSDTYANLTINSYSVPTSTVYENINTAVTYDTNPDGSWSASYSPNINGVAGQEGCYQYAEIDMTMEISISEEGMYNLILGVGYFARASTDRTTVWEIQVKDKWGNFVNPELICDRRKELPPEPARELTPLPNNWAYWVGYSSGVSVLATLPFDYQLFNVGFPFEGKVYRYSEPYKCYPLGSGSVDLINTGNSDDTSFAAPLGVQYVKLLSSGLAYGTHWLEHISGRESELDPGEYAGMLFTQMYYKNLMSRCCGYDLMEFPFNHKVCGSFELADLFYDNLVGPNRYSFRPQPSSYSTDYSDNPWKW